MYRIPCADVIACAVGKCEQCVMLCFDDGLVAARRMGIITGSSSSWLFAPDREALHGVFSDLRK